MAENSADNVEENVATNGESAVKTEGNPWDSPRQSPVNGIVQPRTVPPPDKPTRHTNQLEYLYNHILKDAFKKKLSWPFRAPVNAVELDIPDYHKVIAKPMDLSTIMSRVKNVYYYSANEAVQDVMLMFTNCYTFNPPEYGVCQMAKQLEEYVLGKLQELPETEEEIEKTIAKRGPKGKKKFPSSKNLPNSNKIKDELEPEYLHVIDHFHRATRANSLSRESSVVSIQQKDADSSIVDTHDDNEPMASTSSIPDVSALSSNTVGVKRKADTTTIDDESSAKIGSRRESSRPVKKPNSFFDYTTDLTPAPTPQRKGKKPEVMKFCMKLLNELHSKKYKDFMWPFYQPVDVKGLRLDDYYTVISHPMDLSTVRKNLEQNVYSSAQEFAEDIRLICSNCSTYNKTGAVHEHGLSLLKLFETKFRECPAEDDSLDVVPLSVQTDLNDDEKFNSVLGIIAAEQKKASERVNDLRALHEKIYEVLLQRRQSKLNGTIPPVIDNYLLTQMKQLGIPIGNSFNDQTMAADDMISPTTSVRSSSRAPVPKVFDDIRMEPSVPKPAPVKKSVSRPSIPPLAEIIDESPKPTGPRRGRRPGSKNRPKELIEKKSYQFDSDDDFVSEPMSYDQKIALSQQIQSLDTTLVNEVIRIIERRKGPEAVNRDEMEIDFDKMDLVTLYELQAFVKFELGRPKKEKKMMPIKNAADAEKKKLEIQAELQVLNSSFPNLKDISDNKPPSKPSSSQPPAAKKQRVIASESSSSGSDSSSSSSSDSDSEDEAGPRLDELSKSSFTSLMKSSDFVKSIVPANSSNAIKAKSPVSQAQPTERAKERSSSPQSSAPVKKALPPIRKKSNTPKTRETTPHSRTASPACLDSAKSTDSKELGSSPADILARSYVHPSGHAKIDNMKKIHPTGHASISILDQILPETATFEPPNREKLAKEAREKELKNAEEEKQRRLIWEQQSAQQKADDEQLMLKRQAEARRKRQLELADTVGINQQQELMFNFEKGF